MKRKQIIVITLLLCILSVTPVYADSYGSWVRGKDSGPIASGITPFSNGATSFEYGKDLPDPDEEKGDSWEVRLSTALVHMGLSVSKAMKSGDIDASVTGVIMSHLTNGTGTSFFVFDLTDTNIYGIIAATIYAALRTLVLGFLFIFVLSKLIFTLYEGDIHGLADMKEVIYSAVLTMLLLFIMPQIVDWVCVARDSVAAFLYSRVVDLSGGATDADSAILGVQGLEVPYYNMWADNRSVMNAFIFLMVVVMVPLIYIFSYFKIAIQQVILFGLYPVFALLGYGDSSLNGKWAVHFFSNAFVPTLDMALMFIPALVSIKMSDAGLNDGFLKAVIIVACFVSVVPVRNQILAILGNGFGVRNSVAGAVALGAAAIGGLTAAGKAISAATHSISPKVEAAPEKSEADNNLESHMAKLDSLDDKKEKNDEKLPRSSDQQTEPLKLDEVPEMNKSDKEEAADILTGADNKQIPEVAEERAQAEQEAENANAMLTDKQDLTLSDDNDTAEPVSFFVSTTDSEEDDDKVYPDPVSSSPELYEPAAAPEDNISDISDDLSERISNNVRSDIPESSERLQSSIVTPEDIRTRAEVAGTDKSSPADKRAASVVKSSTRKDLDTNIKRLANLETFGNLRHAESELKSSINLEKNNMFAAQKTIDMNTAKLKELQSSSAPAAQREIEQLTKSNEINNKTIKNSAAIISAKTDEREAIHSQIEQCADIEQGFAGSGKVYSTPESFVKDLERNAKLEQIEKYKSFNPVAERSYMTSQERLEAERKAALMKAGGAALGAAGGLVATGAAMMALSVAGEDAMQEGADQIKNYVDRRVSRPYNNHFYGKSFEREESKSVSARARGL